MHQLPKIILLLSSLFLLTACSFSKYKHLTCSSQNNNAIEAVIKPFVVSKYKASIDVLKNHLTGLIIVKKTDSLTIHIVFVTELGMKMFDFESKNNNITAVYVFEPLNKPLLVEALKRNFSNMFMLNIKDNSFNDCKNKNYSKVLIFKKNDETWFYASKEEDRTLNIQDTFHKRKHTSKIEYVYDFNTKTYTQIKCKQYGLVKFYFELNIIQPSND